MDFGDKLFEVSEHLVGSFTCIQIIATGAEEDAHGSMREYESLGVVSRIHDLRASEAAIDDGRVGIIFGQRFPTS